MCEEFLFVQKVVSHNIQYSYLVYKIIVFGQGVMVLVKQKDRLVLEKEVLKDKTTKNPK